MSKWVTEQSTTKTATAKAQAWGAQGQARRHPVPSQATSKQAQNSWPHKAKPPRCCRRSWVGSSQEGQTPPGKAGTRLLGPSGRWPRGKAALLPRSAEAGTEEPAFWGCVGSFCLWKAGPPLSRGSCPQPGQAKEQEKQLRLPFFSLSCRASGAPELSPNEFCPCQIGTRSACTCVCGHAFYYCRRKLSTVREWVISSPCQCASSCPSSLQAER